jgi:phosphoglycolate phosphatase
VSPDAAKGVDHLSLPEAGAQPVLLLFDIDGTLLQKAYVAHRDSLHAALSAVHGIADPSAFRVLAAGRTDNEIARGIALAAGVAATRIDERAADVREAACREYAARCPANLSGFVAPGIPALLESLAADSRARLALVTGNFEPIARMKLRAAGIGAHFEGCPGGFGSDHEDRTELPAIARARAGRHEGGGRREPWPRERTVVIGDTDRDIACARADGVRVIAVAGGPQPAAELTAADAVAPDARALPALIHAELTR